MQKTNFFLGDCLDVLKTFDDNSFDSIVTDPPYGLSFMGKKWDYDVPSVEIWVECFRVLKPGGHLLAFAGTRTQHRMAVRIEEAGFEIRDMIAWVYGSGFPKSHDVSKAIDKAAGAEREKIRRPSAATAYSSAAGNFRPWMERAQELGYTEVDGDKPVTEAGRQWQGWGTALKPALEPITVARKPLVGTVTGNVLAWGTGGFNIDETRIQIEKETGWGGSPSNGYSGRLDQNLDARPVQGRWPANLIHDGSEEVLGLFPETGKSSGHPRNNKPSTFNVSVRYPSLGVTDDGGSAARFFYCAKASKRDRNDGLDNMPLQDVHRYNAGIGEGKEPDTPSKDQNHHPTVKPTDLMRYLVTLVTPPDGHVLDPFMGSGSTGKGCVQAGFSFTGIEMDNGYLEIAKRRIEHEKEKKRQEAPLLEDGYILPTP
jgi:DNA modification methylase